MALSPKTSHALLPSSILKRHSTQLIGISCLLSYNTMEFLTRLSRRLEFYTISRQVRSTRPFKDSYHHFLKIKVKIYAKTVIILNFLTLIIVDLISLTLSKANSINGVKKFQLMLTNVKWRKLTKSRVYYLNCGPLLIEISTFFLLKLVFFRLRNVFLKSFQKRKRKRNLFFYFFRLYLNL